MAFEEVLESREGISHDRGAPQDIYYSRRTSEWLQTPSGRQAIKDVAQTLTQMWDADKYRAEYSDLAAYSQILATTADQALSGHLPKPYDPDDPSYDYNYNIDRASMHFHYLADVFHDRHLPPTFRAARALPWPQVSFHNDAQAAAYFETLARHIDAFRAHPDDPTYASQVHDLFAPIPTLARACADSLDFAHLP